MKKTVILMFALFVFVAPIFAQLPDDWKTRASTPEDDRIERAEHVKTLKGIGPSTDKDKDGRDWTTRPFTPEDDRIERAWHVYCLKSANCGGDPNCIEREWRAYLVKVANNPDCKKGPDGLCIAVTATTNNKNATPVTLGIFLLNSAKAYLKSRWEGFLKLDPKIIEELDGIMHSDDSKFTRTLVKMVGEAIHTLEEEQKKGTVQASRIKHSTDILDIDSSSQQTIIDCVNIIDPRAGVSFPSEYKFVPGAGFVTVVSVHIEWSGNIPSPAAMKCLETSDSTAFIKELDKKRFDRAIAEDQRRYEAWDRENRTGNRD